MAAYQHYEEANRGSIEVGKLADFVILDKNPHSIPIEKLADLKVMQTIKDGKTIYTHRKVLELPEKFRIEDATCCVEQWTS